MEQGDARATMGEGVAPTVQNSFRVRQMAAYPDPPPVIPLPDTGVAEVTHSPVRGPSVFCIL